MGNDGMINNEIESQLNNIRELKANTLKIVVNDLGNDWRKLSIDLAYTNLVLAESNLLLALSNLKK
jgi:hypothetical protein